MGFLSFIPNVICCELFSCIQLLSFPFVYLILHTLSLFYRIGYNVGLCCVLRVNLNIRSDILFCDRKIRVFFTSFILLQKKKEKRNAPVNE